jgi:YD repeat-containing protein
MTRFVTFALLMMTLGASSALQAQKSPAVELGFAPEKLYQFNDLDSINLFNGNMLLTLPVGQRYQVGAALSYQLTLVYNSKVWDYVVKGGTCEDCCTDCQLAYPNAMANAGVGWRLSLGALHGPNSPHPYGDPYGGFIYESPSGSVHAFDKEPATLTTAVLSHDSAALRLRSDGAYTRYVEFPDGELHKFERRLSVDSNGNAHYSPKWRLTKILERRSANVVDITYSVNSNDMDQKWQLTDTSGRMHVVTFQYSPFLLDTHSDGMIVDKVELQTVGTAGLASRVATWDFQYQDKDVPWPVDHRPKIPLTSPTSVRPMLTAVVQPDDTTVSFAYHLNPAVFDQGSLSVLTLPTGGTLEYDYAPYALPYGDLCGTGVSGFARTPGIRRKRVRQSPTEVAEWEYIHNYGNEVVLTTPQKTEICVLCTNTWCKTQPTPADPTPPRRWSRTTVLAPVVNGTRSRTDHYFSVWSGGDRYPDPLNGIGGSWTYGLPFTAGAPPVSSAAPGAAPASDTASDDGAGHYLSSRFYANCDSAGVCQAGSMQRSTYVGYERTVFGAQLTASRTVYDTDTGCGGVTCWKQTTRSQHNGAGRFRLVVEKSNFPGLHADEKVMSRNYVTWTAEQLTQPTVTWNLDQYSQNSVVTAGAAPVMSEYCHDSAGRVSAVRSYAGGDTPGATDTVVKFKYDGASDLVRELYYGGDQTPLPSTALCSDWNLQPRYLIRHSYEKGMRTKSEYLNPASWNATTAVPLLTVFDRTVDLSTGLTTRSRDAGGAETRFDYDAKPARLVTVTPPAGSATTYEYQPASSTVGAMVKATTLTNTAGANIVTMWHFDSLGRVRYQDSSWAGDDTATRTSTTYDALGRTVAESVPAAVGDEPAAKRTSYQYDPFGRPLQITAPDGSITTMTYGGDRTVTRTSMVASVTGSQQEAVVVSHRDGQGRLVKVTEKSGGTGAAQPVGSDVSTVYAYDSGDRLRYVRMTGSETASNGGNVFQERFFDYDGRGFLRSESHPESVPVFYRYDARGNVIEKSFDNARTPFDLRYSYDDAGRLLTLSGRKPLQLDEFRTLKDFEYVSVGIETGKVRTARRYNYPPDPQSPYAYLSSETVRVDETYGYDSAGRVNARTTRLWMQPYPEATFVLYRAIEQAAQYDELGLLKNSDYPKCLAAPYGCGLPPTNPLVNPLHTYTRGFLTSVDNAVSGMKYARSGLLTEMKHSNLIVDKVEPDPAGLMRPRQITFEHYDEQPCVVPAVSVQVKSSENPSILTLVAAPTGTAPYLYQWFRDDGTSVTLIGRASTITVPAAPSTTDFYVKIDNGCGSATSNRVKATSPAAAPSGLVASAQTPPGAQVPTSILITWQPGSGSGQFALERRSDGAAFEFLASVDGAVSSYSDSANLQPGHTYAYRIRRGISPFSNVDIATMMGFDPIADESLIEADYLHDVLGALNAMRHCVGWAAVTWQNILPAGMPAPAQGVFVHAEYVRAIRSRMNDVLQALGMITTDYIDTDPSGRIISRQHILDLQERAR